MRILSITAVAALLLAACSASPEAPSTRPAAEAAEEASAPAKVEPLTRKQARAMLVRVKDLPSGWGSVPEGESGFDWTVRPKACEWVLTTPARFPTEDLAVAVFTDGSSVFASSFSQRVYRVKGKSASWRLDQLRKHLGNCGKFTFTNDQGTEKHRISEVSFPAFGEDSIAVRDTIVWTDGNTYTDDSVYVAVRGATIRFMSTGSATPLPGGELEQLVRASMSRLPD
ncbi:hypothetical protein [Kineosporia sp. NBRC 101731]|uniref:hypothetical protein n=1 Tax=Kineosporia sp. NBRC 101731 TaxID=3032199 RepID=UPI0025572A3E|nr:hypothetical protein [Kineosporia sp. NBRC 101731]